MVLGEALEPKPGPQEAPRGQKTMNKTKNEEIMFSECQWAAQCRDFVPTVETYRALSSATSVLG